MGNRPLCPLALITHFQKYCPKIGIQYGTQPCGAIGILLGSFNPAHQGHLHLSQIAQKKLRLRALWWWITPRNPLKQITDYAPLGVRLQQAENLAFGKNIAIATPEILFQKNYTLQSLYYLRRAFLYYHFILLMGSDNLYQLPAWHQFKKIQRNSNLAIIRREPMHYPALLRFRGQIKGLNQRYGYSIVRGTGKIIYIDASVHVATSTSIRQEKI